MLLDEAGSTNDEAKRLIAAHESEGTVVIAASQTSGRGRLGRKWVSPIGGIYLSIILNPYINHSRLPIITLMAAVACARTLKGMTKLDVSVKWPNDIVISDKKAGGILCETFRNSVIVGIGINLNTNLSLFPVSLKKQVTSVKFELGASLEREDVIRILLEEMDRVYAEFLDKRDREIIDEWTGLCRMLGSEVTIETGRGKHEGYAEAVGSKGELILRGFDGKIRRIFSADAVKVRTENI